MKKIKFFVIYFLVFLMLIIPSLSLAAGLVPCDNSSAHPCDFNALMALINTVVKFILFDMAIPIAAIMFAYAGFLMVTAGGEAAGARTKAKSIFTNAIFGLVLAVAAWLIVNTILSILGYTGDWIGFVRPLP
jgi:hypothetical protein